MWNGHGRLRSARQQKVWKALQKSSQFVEVPLSFDEIRDNIIAADKGKVDSDQELHVAVQNKQMQRDADHSL